MYCAKTDNMKKAADELLAYHDFCYNIQKSSSAEAKPEYTYIIQGWKKEKKVSDDKKHEVGEPLTRK